MTMLDDGWKFTVVENGEDSSTYGSAGFDDSLWESVIVPHTPRLESIPVADQWQGECWYRRNIGIPHKAGQTVYLTIGAAMNIADLWVNGIHISKHYGGYLPFVADITSVLHSDRDNMIAVRLDNTDSPVTGPQALDRLDFNTYGGLYRNVFLSVKDALHITDAICENKPASGGIRVVCTRSDSLSGELRVTTHVKNGHGEDKRFRVVNELYREGKLIKRAASSVISLAANADTESEISLCVENPALWSHLTPDLYELRTSIKSGDRTIDVEKTNVAFRTIALRDKKLYVNDSETFLSGVNRHQEYPYIGYALSDNAQWRDAWLIKQAGFDYVRASHYPPSPAFLDACDHYGIWVLDAIPGWQYFNADPAFTENAMQTIRDMIRRDRNHPCILAWEASLNETNMPEPFIIEANRVARREAPEGFTAGWMPIGYDIYLQARQHRSTGETYDRPMIVSEYGDWEYYAQNAGFNQYDWQNLREEERTSRQLLEAGEKRLLQQTLNIQEAHNDNYNYSAFADGYWAMFDYNRGYAPDLEASGVASIFRQPKFSYMFFESQRNDPPMVGIASHWDESSSPRVKVFSNCDEVELLLNDRSMGKQRPVVDASSNNLAHPPIVFDVGRFEPGNLRAVGFRDGEKVAEQTVSTPGTPERIRLDAAIHGTVPGTNDVIIIHAAAVGSDGTICVSHAGFAEFSVAGDATLVGDNPVRFRAGVASILLRTGLSGGQVAIRSISDDLIEGDLLLDME